MKLFTMNRSLSVLILITCISQVRAEQRTDTCVNDLAKVSEFLRRDYAGYKIAESTIGTQIQSAYQIAYESAEGKSGEACDKAIRKYLNVFRDGHLVLPSDHSETIDWPPPLFHNNRAPRIQTLSKDEILLRVPSFAVGYTRDLNRILIDNETQLRKCKTLILDVRGNTGGSDSAWVELIKPIYSKPMTRTGVSWFATPGNADAIDAQIKQIGSSAPKSVCNAFQKIADDMRAEKSGTFVELGPSVGPVATLPEVWESPKQVAILVDKYCSSTCENFMIAAAQSSKVTIFGQKTWGAIDFQNVRIEELPSKERRIMFAMSATNRVVVEKKRHFGVQPDHKLSTELLRDVDGAVQKVKVAMRSQD